MVRPETPDDRKGSDPFRSQRVALVIATAGAGLTVLGTFVPWLYSGRRGLSSYELVDLAERLGFAPGGWIDWSLKLWPLIPLLMALAAAAAWFGVVERSLAKLAIALSLAAAGWLVATAVAVVRAPDVALFRLGPGLWVATLGSVVTLGACVSLGARSGVRRRGLAASEAS